MKIIYTGGQTTTDQGAIVETGAVITTLDEGENADVIMSGISGDRWLNRAIETGQWEVAE